MLIAKIMTLVSWPLALLTADFRRLPLGGFFCVVGIGVGFFVTQTWGDGLQLTWALIVYLAGMGNVNFILHAPPEQDINGNIVVTLIGSGILLGMLIAHLLY